MLDMNECVFENLMRLLRDIPLVFGSNSSSCLSPLERDLLHGIIAIIRLMIEQVRLRLLSLTKYGKVKPGTPIVGQVSWH